MEYRDIDSFIARYAEERRHTPKNIAQQHLLSHAYMVTHGCEVDSFLRRVRVLALIHIESVAIFEHPLRNAQCCWLLFFPVGFAFSLFLTTHHETALLGLIYCAATVIYGTSLFIMVMQQWIDNCIQIDFYREIIDLIDSQQIAQDQDRAPQAQPPH